MIKYVIQKNEALLPIKKHNIEELSILKRIETNYPILVRETVAIKLIAIAKKLPKGFLLQIDSGHRSRKSQEAIWNYRLGQIKNIQKTRQLVFDPSKGEPPHTTGGAVDVSLLDKNKKEINLSEPFKKFYEEPCLYSPKISKGAQRLRIILNKLMLDEEFAPNEREYWHFSYGDAAWAKYYGKKLIYNEVEVSNKFHYSLNRKFFNKYSRLLYRLLRTFKLIEVNY